MNTVKASKPSGLKRVLAFTALAVFILSATGCGSSRGGGGKVCSAYGGKQPSANQVQDLH